MCGIAGIWSSESGAIESLAPIRAMCRSLQHRGPDDGGLYHDEWVHLGHQRLSIIDLEGGHQPLCNEDESLWIAYNGELFNYRELARGLRARGHRFRTRSDTEVILHLYEEKGPDCLHDLNGQFAFAIWDRRRQELFLARDRFGILPLFYALANGKFIFASEVKAILASGEVDAEMDPFALEHFTTLGFLTAPRTMFRGVRALPAGFFLRLRDGHVDLQRYWDVEFPVNGEHRPLDHRECEEALRAHLREAVRSRLVADVPVGIYLSGGIDSCTVAGFMAQVADEPPRAFTIGFPDTSLDESCFSKLMSDSIEAPVKTVLVRDATICEKLPRLLWHTECPMFSVEPAAVLSLSGLTSRHLKVVLTGQGGDEAFAGYPIYALDKLRRFFGRPPLRIVSAVMRELLNRKMGDSALFPSRAEEAAVTEEFGFYPALNLLYNFLNQLRGLYSHDMQREVRGFSAIQDAAFDLSRTNGRHPLDQSLYLTCKTLLDNFLLSVQGDRPSMANAVEMRFPYLDHHLFDFAAHLPPQLRLRRLNEKAILKSTVGGREVPQAIARRRKKSFSAPYGLAFIREDAPELIRTLLRPETVKAKGYFDPARVSAMVTRMRQIAAKGELFKGKKYIGFSRDIHDMYLYGMGINLVVTTHLWDEVFLEKRWDFAPGRAIDSALRLATPTSKPLEEVVVAERPEPEQPAPAEEPATRPTATSR